MLPHDGLVGTLLQSFLFLCGVGTCAIFLRRADNIYFPFVSADQRHDVAHVRAIDGEAMASSLEILQHDAVEVDPFLGGHGVGVTPVGVFFGLAAINSNVELKT